MELSLFAPQWSGYSPEPPGRSSVVTAAAKFKPIKRTSPAARGGFRSPGVDYTTVIQPQSSLSTFLHSSGAFISDVLPHNHTVSVTEKTSPVPRRRSQAG